MSNDLEESNDSLLTEKHKFWQSHVCAWEQSGGNQSEYCRDHELNIKIFGYWKRKLLRKSEGGVSFVPVSIKPSHTTSAGSVASLKLVTGNGYGIEVGDGFNPATLRMLLDAIGQRV